MRSITAQDLYQFELITGVRISPDGKYVVYAQQRIDKKSQKVFSNLWIADTKKGSPRQFTYGDQYDGNPVWSPDSKTIAFTSNRKKDYPSQVYLIPVDGGEARVLTDFKGRLGKLTWSPDGKSLVCSARLLDPEEVERLQDEEKKKLGTVVRHYKRLFFKLDGEGYLPQERWHIWKFDARSGKGTQLTNHPVWDERDPAISPDGKQIAFISNRTDDPDQQNAADSLYVMPFAGGEPTLLVDEVGDKAQPSFSPDGKHIAFYFQVSTDTSKNLDVCLAENKKNGKWINLTDKHDLHCVTGVIADMGGSEQMPPLWTKDGKKVMFSAQVHGSSNLHSVTIDGKTKEDVIQVQGAVGSWCTDSKQDYLAYVVGSISDPWQVAVLHNGATRIITKVNHKLLSGINLSKVEEIWYKGPVGNDLQGWIMTPPDFNPKKKYPTLLYIHGGPKTQYGFAFMHEFYFLAAQGYVVVFTNPRGGKGYGLKHTYVNKGKWGQADYDDLMAFTDLVEKLPYVDKKNMGVLGGSYGGFMTLWIIGHTNRFKAANAQRSVFNMVSEWGSSDFNHTFEEEFGAFITPFVDYERFWNMSPMKYIGNAKTPTLIIHSENDHRCPIEQSEQAFVALKRLGVETEFVRFPDEFHGLSRNGRTDRRIVRLQKILEWFDRHLKS